MKTFEEDLADHFAETGRYAENAESLYQSFKRRSAIERGAAVLTASQQVRLAVMLKLMEDPVVMGQPPVQIANLVSLAELIVLHPERFRPPDEAFGRTE